MCNMSALIRVGRLEDLLQRQVDELERGGAVAAVQQRRDDLGSARDQPLPQRLAHDEVEAVLGELGEEHVEGLGAGAHWGLLATLAHTSRASPGSIAAST
jgi:hypothetical protein